jgi:hypothetical protein
MFLETSCINSCSFKIDNPSQNETPPLYLELFESSPASSKFSIETEYVESLSKDPSLIDSYALSTPSPPIDLYSQLMTPNFTSLETFQELYLKLSEKVEQSQTLGLSRSDISKLQLYSNSTWDIDYFAIDLQISKLWMNGLYPIGPKVDCISFVKMKNIQDPVVNKMKYANVISLSPILVFEDISDQFPLRSKLVQFLNDNSSLKMSVNRKKKSGAVFYKHHYIHTFLLMKGLESIGINILRFSMYGTKFPLNLLVNNHLLVSLFTQSDPLSSYFDIAKSVPMDKIIVTDFGSLPKSFPTLKKFPYFGYLYNGNYGGFSFETEENGSKMYFKWYSLVYHYIAGNTNLKWNVPKLKRNLKKILLSLQDLTQKLKDLPNDIGGYRVEIRYFQKGFWESLNDFKTRKPFHSNYLCQWIDSICDTKDVIHVPPKLLEFETITKRKYFDYLDAMMAIAFNVPNPSELYGGGLFHGDVRKPLDENERKMAETLFNSFGYYSERQRRFDCSSDINDWIGEESYPEIENWEKIISASKKIGNVASESNQRNLTGIIEIQEEILNDILKYASIWHPKNNSKKFSTNCKGNIGATKAFNTKRELAIFIYEQTIMMHHDEPSQWRLYFSTKK